VVSTITDAGGDIQANVLPIAAAGLAVGVTVLSVRKGWRWFKGFLG
jgi:hypothetical protein